jgi:hypothetical protein
VKVSKEGLITVAVIQLLPAAKARGAKEARPAGRRLAVVKTKMKPDNKANKNENRSRIDRRSGLEFDIMTILRSLVVNPEGWQNRAHHSASER